MIPTTLILALLYAKNALLTRTFPQDVSNLKFVIGKPRHDEQQIAQSIQENYNVRGVADTSGIPKTDDLSFRAPTHCARDVQLGRLDTSSR